MLIVTTLSPERIPYWEGYSYKILITKFVPRIFWENKPSDTFGNEFGVRYKVLSDYNSTTSWNMPVLNEFYVNFGIIGINDGSPSHSEIPFGGFNQSGIGKEGGSFALSEYTQKKYVSLGF